jgi:hypothetical protein
MRCRHGGGKRLIFRHKRTQCDKKRQYKIARRPEPAPNRRQSTLKQGGITALCKAASPILHSRTGQKWAAATRPRGHGATPRLADLDEADRSFYAIHVRGLSSLAATDRYALA